MPAEWEPHSATWLSWPHRKASWPGAFAPIPRVWVELVRALAPHEPVHVSVRDARMESEVRSLLRRGEVPPKNVCLHRIPTNDAWARDHGPIFLVGPRRDLLILDWVYNAWGGKYPPWDDDDAVPRRVAAVLDLPVVEPGRVLEGGSIDVDGEGTLLTTEGCLLNPNRNPSLSRREIEEMLMDYLGIRKVLWLGQGVAGDDTDGHVDDLARFVGPATVLCALEEDRRDENYRLLRDAHRRLQKMTDARGRPLQVVTLPTPGRIERSGHRLPASYLNFYIANGVVVVPVFDDPNDARVLETLRRLFPGREIVGLRSRDLIVGLGAVHCVTQQQPRP